MARTKRVWRTVGWLIGGAALLGWSGAAPADGEGVQEVTVLNFPDLQRVDGAVAVKAPVQLDSQFVQRKLTVVPAGPTKARAALRSAKTSIFRMPWEVWKPS